MKDSSKILMMVLDYASQEVTQEEVIKSLPPSETSTSKEKFFIDFSHIDWLQSLVSASDSLSTVDDSLRAAIACAQKEKDTSFIFEIERSNRRVGKVPGVRFSIKS